MVVLRDLANFPSEGYTQGIVCTVALLYHGWGWFHSRGIGCINCYSAHIVGIIIGYCCLFVLGSGDWSTKTIFLVELLQSLSKLGMVPPCHFQMVVTLVGWAAGVTFDWTWVSFSGGSGGAEKAGRLA